ncbi:MAG: FAD-binding oxidoreductase [Caldilineales bacterium]|nr:FAD-binding oxidoreductase [Caldilineales bacterium]
MTRILIIGGGIIGVSSAYFLAAQGYEVLLLERQPTLGSVTTAASLQAVRSQFADPVNIDFMRGSLAFYETFADRLDLPGHDIGFHQQGYLFVTTTEQGAAQLQARVAFQQSHGLEDVAFLTGEALHRRFPYLAAEALAATFRQRDGWLSAHEVIEGFRQAAARYRVTFRTRSRVEVLALAGGRVVGVRTPEGVEGADAVVLAAGPFTAGLAATIGVALPLAAVRRHRFVIGEHAAIPHTAPMTVDHDTGAHWRPEGPGAALAWAEPEPPSPPEVVVSPDPGFPFRVLEGVYRLSPFWLQVAESLKRDQVFLHAGQYTVTPDHNPLIGPVPGQEELWINSGFSGHGVMAAPAAGQLLADLIAGRRPAAANPFALDRAGLGDGAAAGGEHMVI